MACNRHSPLNLRTQHLSFFQIAQLGAHFLEPVARHFVVPPQPCPNRTLMISLITTFLSSTTFDFVIRMPRAQSPQPDRSPEVPTNANQIGIQSLLVLK